MEYKAGSKVRIVSEKSGKCWNDEGKMDKWLGKVMTVREARIDDYKMKEDALENDGYGWFWEEDMIAGLATENKMPEVAALFGKELGEEFDITDRIYNPYKFTEKGLVGCNGVVQENGLHFLSTGKWTIIKKPWKPKNGDIIHYVNTEGEIVATFFYTDVTFFHALLHSGNCFRTEQEAEASREAIMEKFGWK